MRLCKKDIQTLKERRTRRNSSLGNHFAKASPALVRNPFGKASLCAFLKNLSTKLKKASLTVEAAMVLPLFFLTMVTMISFMDLYKLQTEHLSKLCQNANGCRNVRLCSKRRNRRDYASGCLLPISLWQESYRSQPNGITIP